MPFKALCIPPTGDTASQPLATRLRRMAGSGDRSCSRKEIEREKEREREREREKEKGSTPS